MKRSKKFNRNRNEQGFSLIEMLIVVAIMLILVAALAPAVVASLQSGGEQSTVNSMATFAKAQTAYAQLYPSLGYAAKAANLGGTQSNGCPSAPDASGAGAWSCLLPDDSAKSIDAGTPLAGYKYTYTSDGAKPSAAWTLIAVPNAGINGRRSYCVDASGQIKYVLGTTAPTTANNVCASGTTLGQ